MSVDYKNLKIGDVFYECVYGENYEYEVITEPEVEQIYFNESDTPYNRYSWEAKRTKSKHTLKFVITEGLEHYGPQLYYHPAYGNFKKGKYDIEVK